MAETAIKKMNWLNFGFFLFTGTVGVLGTPLYAYFYGFKSSDIALFLFFFIATGISVTVGYHRLFAHVTYKAHPLVRLFFLFFGAAAFEQSALKWVSQHRNHHLYTDTERDPYSSKKGFWYSHIGWLIAWAHQVNYDNVHDLKKDRLVMHQHNYYGLWALTAGIIVPVLIGALFGSAGGAFISAVCFRIAFVHHMTFCINSVCHFMGKRTYDLNSSARDHWLVALFTFGEGYHNFHHRFPSDYRNGIRWYHWDPSKWCIAFLCGLGLTHDLKKIAPAKILYARIAAEKELASSRLAGRVFTHPDFSRLKQTLDETYAQVQKALGQFDKASVFYRSVLTELRATKTEDFKKAKSAAYLTFCSEKSHFKHRYKDWMTLMDVVVSNVKMIQVSKT